MTGAPRVFGYVRLDEPDARRLVAFRLEIGDFCRSAGWELISVFHDAGIDNDSERLRMGFSRAVSVLGQQEDSVLVVPDLTHLASDETLREALISRITAVKALLRTVRKVQHETVSAGAASVAGSGLRLDPATNGKGGQS